MAIRSTNLPPSTVIDELIGHASGSTVRVSLTKLAALIGGLSGPTFKFHSELAADLAWPAGTVAAVWGDTDALSGVYQKNRAAGIGSWTRIGDRPDFSGDVPQFADQIAEVGGLHQGVPDAIAGLTIGANAYIFEERTAAAVALAKATLSDGDVFWMDGQAYRLDSSLTLADSVTNDLGQDGVATAGPLSVEQFGAFGDDEPDHNQDPIASTDNTAAIQTAVDACTRANGNKFEFGPGAFRVNGAVNLGSSRNVKVDMAAALLTSYSPTSMFDLGWDVTGAGTVASNVKFEGGRIEARVANTAVFRIQNAYAPCFRDIDLRLLAADQTGFLIRGNPPPYYGPYYGVMDNVRIFGNATPDAGQHGIRFLTSPVDYGATSDGVNRWCLSNIRHIAAVDYGIDVVNAHGMAITNVNFEACYKIAARFNERPPDHGGAVTTGGGASSFSDSSLPAGVSGSAAVIVNSGLNAGRSQNVSHRTGSTLYFREAFPFPFAAGDTYSLYESKARDITISNATCETAGTIAKFAAGARNCKVDLAFATIAATSTYFTRAIEDMSNTIARRYDTFTFEGTVPAGGGEVWLSPVHIASNRGGVVLPERGWLDAAYATGAVRGIGGAGEIDIDVFANGAQQGSAGMTAKLTPHSPNRASRVRTSLKSADMILPGQAVKVRAVGSADLLVNETVRAEIYIGYL